MGATWGLGPTSVPGVSRLLLDETEDADPSCLLSGLPPVPRGAPWGDERKGADYQLDRLRGLVLHKLLNGLYALRFTLLLGLNAKYSLG